MDKARSSTEIVYTPSSRPRGFTWTGFSLRAYVDLLLALVSSQIKVRYRYTAVGLGWAVINPLLLMLVYAFVFGQIFGEPRANYRLFLLAGLLPWQAFSAGMTGAVRSLISGRDLLKKAPFPSELLPVASVFTAMTNFLIVFVVYIGYLAITGQPAFAAFHWILVALVIQTVFLTGAGLIVAATNVFLRDVEQLVTFGVWIWFFLTPIIYPLARLEPDQARLILLFNPMAVVVSTLQNALLRGQAPSAILIGIASLWAVALLVGGWALFRRLQYELPKAA